MQIDAREGVVIEGRFGDAKAFIVTYRDGTRTSNVGKRQEIDNKKT
jgi:hypothetical protein